MSKTLATECKQPECDRKGVKRADGKHCFPNGLCAVHHMRMYRYGRLELLPPRARSKHTPHPLNSTYRSMLTRCYNPNAANYYKYGGRGITVHRRWRKCFKNFVEDMGDRPEGYTLERIDNLKGYSPSNCRWATRKEQANNTRNNTQIVAMGSTKTIAQWSEQFGIPYQVLYTRLRNGWSPEEALTTKVRVRTRKSGSVEKL